MPGAFVRDAFEPNLESGVVLNAAGTDSGVSVDVMRPGDIRVELKTGTVSSTGNTGTFNLEIQASDDSTFSTGVVSLGRFATLSGTDVSQSSLTRYLNAYTQKRYARATLILGGTAPNYTGTTIRIVPEDTLRSDADSA